MAAKFWNKKVILAQVEATYGTDSAPTGASNAVLAKNVSFNPAEGADKDLAHETPMLGNSGTLPVDQHSTLSFEVDLAPSGTAGTAPAFGALLRGCGMAETLNAATSVIYNPISGAMDSLTLWLVVDGILFAFVGARGAVKLMANASSEPMLQFSFTGLYSKPLEISPPTPDLSSWRDPVAVSKKNTPVFTIDGTALFFRNFTLDFGNEVQPRFLANKEEIRIVDRAETIQTQIESIELATFDPWALSDAQARVPLILQHGTTAGNITTINVPEAQIMRPGAPTEAQKIMEWPLNLRPMPMSGNDQFTLTFT
ncbi:hypothetical protein J4E08_10085 [Sagittula sp. NFXS13]|uniref:phage tail tube protein n=1 Tax=Sagittula sp. NFXS13 TaxID=2819095 RepID=UPI0032DEE5E5